MAHSPPPQPHDQTADARLTQLTDAFRSQLAYTAESLSLGRKVRKGEITVVDVEEAYTKLTSPTKASRAEAQKIITSAFKENRLIQFVGYGMAVALFTFGLVLLGYAIFGPADVVGRVAGLVGGSFAQILLLIPLRFAINARRSNLAIRILGHLLDRVDDPQLLAEMIRRLIHEVAPDAVEGRRGMQ
jgi:hypothetical protein